ncbi:acetylcholinesterase-1-like [Ornithodoros turicata]|uniref:acetylcholinesterase-1-like n=1 Tax=Ornithodoros turicata TaxID=34597 RepID=UPI003138A4AB
MYILAGGNARRVLHVISIIACMQLARGFPFIHICKAAARKRSLLMVRSQCPAILFVFTLYILSAQSQSASVGNEPTPGPVVFTRSGYVRGLREVVEGRSLDVFYGIPYAEPPVGPLRFKKPVPTMSWSAPLDATEKKPSCVQFSGSSVMSQIQPSDDVMSEDCLHLNIWAPTGGKSKAVIIFLYGGGFQWGSNRWLQHDARYLAALGDVVLVAPNYRVGVLGFLNGRNANIPGNAGVWDTLLALRWVKCNVLEFGGNPDMITVMGESAGAVITGLLMISPVSELLFRRAIMQGGSPFWYLGNTTGSGPSTVNSVALKLGCGVTFKDNPSEVVQCLRNASASDLVNKTSTLFGILPYQLFPSYSDRLFPEPHITMITKGPIRDVDLLIGSNADEGAFFALPTLKWLLGENYYDKLSKRKLISTFTVYIQIVTGFDAKDLVKSYFEGLEETDKTGVLKAVAKVMGDYAISCPALFLADEVSRDRTNAVYFYEFSYRPTRSTWPPWVQATHSQELEFTLGSVFLFADEFSDDDRQLSRDIIQTWTSFAKTGKPSPLRGTQWEKYTPLKKAHLRINSETSVVAVSHRPRCDLLKKYIKQYFE